MAPTPQKTAPATEDEVGRISVKIPPFWERNPEVWFIQVEAQFSVSRVSADDTKFNHILAQLDPKYLEYIWDIISGDSSQKYTDAKERLLGIFKTSEEAKLHKLLNELERGDMRPSHLLVKMRALAGEDISDKALSTLWLNKMPEAIKGILVISEGDLDKQATLADKILQISHPAEAFAARTEGPCHPGKKTPVKPPTDTVQDRIEKLERRFAEMPFSKGQHSQPKHQGQDDKGHSRGKDRQRSNGLCYYHNRFGARARNCKQPCSWQNPGNSSLQQN